MNKIQVDVKAILSHIVRGDGLSKCRICMGETTEGQVHLTDTVIMDGDKPVTLSELLEIITGIQVEESRELPNGICYICISNALSAFHFKRLCNESIWHWGKAITILPHIDLSGQHKTIYIFYEEESIFKDEIRVDTVAKAIQRLNVPNSLEKAKRKKKTLKFNGLQCHDCGKKFSLPHNWNKHIKNTSNRVCVLCSKIIHKAKLAKHLKITHNKIVYPCEKCYQLFNEKRDVEQHNQIYHQNKKYQCNICGCGFKNERSLTAHIYSHSLFNCDYCNTSFENRRCYKHHILKCKGSKNLTKSLYFECHDCGQRYDKKPSLKTHITQKHINVLQYICQICGKRSSTYAHQKTHESIHLTERQTFQCYCGAKMHTVLGFKMHQRIHSGEKPYECKECGERFLSASRRLDHVKRKHLKEMAHACDKCGARFMRPFQLKKHYRNTHFMEMIEDDEICPKGVCVACANSVVAAHEFRTLVRKSEDLWSTCLQSLNNIPEFSRTKSLYAIIKDNLTLQTIDCFDGNAANLLDHLKNRFTKKKPAVSDKKPRHPRTGPACVCTDCGKTFLSPYYLNLHLKNSGVKECCWTCGVMLGRGQKMKEHLEIEHKIETFLCQDCPMLAQSDVDLKRHRKKCHGHGIRTCADCGRTFQRTASFDVHSQMHAVRTCRACGAQFTNRGCYREHRSKCEPEAKPDLKTIPRNRRSNVRDPAMFTCDYCGKTYHSRPQLKNHILWIHLDVRPHQCQWCGKRFYTPARLAEHSVVHTRVRNFECDICGAKLVSKMAAVYHRRRHTGERPYECEDCGEKFISSSRRSEHAKRRHNKGLRLQCLECPASFVRNHELKRHVEKAHNSECALKFKKLKEICAPIV